MNEYRRWSTVRYEWRSGGPKNNIVCKNLRGKYKYYKLEILHNKPF